MIGDINEYAVSHGPQFTETTSPKPKVKSLVHVALRSKSRISIYQKSKLHVRKLDREIP